MNDAKIYLYKPRYKRTLRKATLKCGILSNRHKGLLHPKTSCDDDNDDSLHQMHLN